MISTRSVELVIDTVVCLTLAKWETVSGQFGGYLRLRIVAVSERNHLAALQQPSEAGAVVSRQAAVTGVPPFWRLVEAEQVRRRPAQRFGLLAPLGQKPASVSDALPPALDRDEGRRPELQNAEHLPVPQRLRQLDDLDLGADD